MFTLASLTVCLMLCARSIFVNGELYEDRRCSCICPVIEEGYNGRFTKSFFRDNLPAFQCNCYSFVLPRVRDKINETRTHAFCQQCECTFEMRNTTIIKVVVIFLCCLLLMLLLYMMCMQVMKALTKNRTGIVREHASPCAEEQMDLLQDGETRFSSDGD